MLPLLAGTLFNRSTRDDHRRFIQAAHFNPSIIHLGRVSTDSANTSLTYPSISELNANKNNNKKKKYLFPFEGKLYDPISVTNFIDLDKYKATATLMKSIPINWLSKMLDADLPIKVTLAGKLGTLGAGDGMKMNPMARAGFNLRLLDLGSTLDSRQKGYLRFKAAVRTDGRRDHGFEIDRKVEVLNLSSTMLYGNVLYKTNNRSQNHEWKTSSSFGIHQDLRIAGIKFATRLGFTPEGKFVYDLKL